VLDSDPRPPAAALSGSPPSATARHAPHCVAVSACVLKTAPPRCTITACSTNSAAKIHTNTLLSPTPAK
jgi:hypothetical protein